MSQPIFGILGAALFCSLYLVGRAARSAYAWANRNDGPRERVGVYLVVFGVMGAFAGWLVYEPAAAARQCHIEGKPVVSCTFFPC